MSALGNGKRNQGGTADEVLVRNVSKRRRTNYKDYNSNWGYRQDYTPGSLSHGDYNVGWICALPIEMAAARAMLDGIHPTLPGVLNDSNAYTLGNIGRHNIVIACLPSGHYGTNNAATVASNMRRSFPSIHIKLMVGIGGGVPGKVDVRLGDVVVSDKVVPYDFGKTVREDRFERTGLANRPPQGIMAAVSKLRATHESACSQILSILSEMLQRNPLMTRYIHPGPLQDQLFQNTYDHVQSVSNCDQCDTNKSVNRPSRDSTDPKIHYGVIASGNQVMKNAKTRDKLAEELDVLCFEMEAAGLMDNFPCLVIRGICDYSDSHKNKKWQEYAAAAAAAYTKELLSVIPSNAILTRPTDTTHYLTSQFYALAHAVTLADIVTEQPLRKDLLDSLRFDQIDSRQANIKAAHAKTCKWFLEHSDYVDWLNPDKYDQHYGFLWISGKPGAGKSTLMKFVYAHAKKKASCNAATIAFFFNARGGDLEKSTAGMYRSLLLQLLEKFPALQEVFDDPEHVCEVDHASRSGWGVELLQELFALAVQKLNDRSLTCFIDALDECDERQVRDMVRYFEQVSEQAVQNRCKLSICFSSRHYPYIDIRIGRKLTLEDQIGHGDDLDRYVRSSLAAGKGRHVEEVRAGILEKAQGVFMWVVLVVEILNEEFRRGRIFAVKKRLRELPPELSDLFKDMLLRDRVDMDNFLLCIQWILYAKRPLKQEEFYYAIVSGLDPDPENLAEWNPEYITRDNLHRFVLSSSKGLAEIAKSNAVQFIHESVRDFLIKDNGLRNLWPELGQDFQSFSHDRLKQCCHTYMRVNVSVDRSFDEALPKASSDAARDLRQRISEKFPFLEYATRHVLYHADAAANGLPQDEFVKEFPLEAWINFNNLFEKYEIRRHTPSASLLYILAENNLARLIRTTLHSLSSIDIQGERHRYPLFAALDNGHQDAVKALLQQETSLPQQNDISAQLEYGRDFISYKDQTPFLWAVENGHLGLAKLLIGSSELSPCLKNPRGSMALLRAAQNGHEDVVKLLLAIEGVNANLIDKNGWTALSSAATNGHVAIVKLLLTIEGVNANSIDKSGRTPISWAAENGHEAIVKLLLTIEGVNANSIDKSGRTPLLWAAKNGHEATVKLLLTTEGVDANYIDKSGRTPLMRAASNGHEAIVKSLLASPGVNTNLADKDGWTPLMWATSNGHEAVVKLLLATEGVDINLTNKYGWTALSRAASNGPEAIVKSLLATEGINVNLTIWDGSTALLRAAENGREAVVKLLLATEGIDANLPDNYGKTPLRWAAENRHKAVIKLLLAAEGVDASLKSIHGSTALSRAAENGHEAIVKLLQ